MYFFMTVEIPYSQHNNLISLISQVLIGPYLIYSVHPLPHFLLGCWLSYEILNKGGLDRVSIFRGGCWERSGDLFQDGGLGEGGGGSFYIKNKLKSEIFNDKKSL